MNLITAYKKLEALAPLFSTRDASSVLELSLKHASTTLSRLAKSGMIVHLVQGRWAYSTYTDPLLLPAMLTHPAPCYVSLYTALYFHGMIEQIPSAIYAISLAKTNRYETLLGNVSIHHINANLFCGYERYGKNDVYMATPEKALFDTLYLAPAKSLLFRSLTEIELPKSFKKSQFDIWVKRIKNTSRRSFVEKSMIEVLSLLKSK